MGELTHGRAHWGKMFYLIEAGGVYFYSRGTIASVRGLLILMGQIEEAQTALTEADTIGYRDHLDPLLENVRGQLLSAQGCSPEEVETCFLRAIHIAQRQQAKWQELQAAMSLARLWQAQGRQQEARDSLTAVYDWFTEGFDTPILQAAAARLEELT